MTEPGKEQQFLERYAERLGATTGAIIVLTDFTTGRGVVLASADVDCSYLKSYEEYYGSVNVYLQRLKRQCAPPVVQPGEAICPDDELIRTEYYNDYMRPQRVHYSIGMAMPLGGGLRVHLGACRPKNAGPFGPDENAVAEAIAAHLEPVVRIRERFLRVRQRAAGLSQFNDELPFGVVLLSTKGTIIETNRRADEILRAGDGLLSRKGELSAASPMDASALRRLVSGASVTGQGNGLDTGGALRVSRPSLRRSYNLLVSPFRPPGPDSFQTSETPAVLVIVVDPEQEQGCQTCAFCRLYSLTPAETGVCRLLLDGQSAREIAAELKITMNTARTHIKRILSKTETSRQSELVRLALSSSPVRGY